MSTVKHRVANELPTGKWFGLDAVSRLNMSNTAFLQYMGKIKRENDGLVERRVHAVTNKVSFKWGKETKKAYLKVLKGGEEMVMSRGFELFYLVMNA